VTPGEFFDLLFGEAVGEDAQIVLFTGRQPSWTCRWFEEVDAAAECAASLEGEEVYFGTSLQNKAAAIERATKEGEPPRPESRVRGHASTAVGIPGFWLDLDWVDPAHKKENYPPNKAQCLRLVAELPAPPTLILDTGGGLHLWWLFNEFWHFLDDPDRVRAADLSAKWQIFAHETAQRLGKWKVDSTFDLARVMRIPGTVSQKHGRVITVEALRDEARYEPGDFEEWLPHEPLVKSVDACGALSGDTVIQSAAEPPGSKVMLLTELDADFARTWERRRTDLASASEYDLSLLTIAAKAGWTEQELVDLGIAFRRKYGEDLKLRDTYWGPTVAKAIAADKGRKASEWLQESLAAPKPAGDSESESLRQERLRALSELLGAPVPFSIKAIMKFEGEPPTYRMVVALADRAVDMPLREGAQTFAVHNKLRMAVMTACQVDLPPIKPAAWRPNVQPLLEAIEVVSVGPSDSVASQITSWLLQYTQGVVVAPNPTEGYTGRGVFTDPQGRLCVTINKFAQWLLMRGERYGERRLGTELRIAGCLPVQFAYERELADGSTTRGVFRAWALPADSSTAHKQRKSMPSK